MIKRRINYYLDVENNLGLEGLNLKEVSIINMKWNKITFKLLDRFILYRKTSVRLSDFYFFHYKELWDFLAKKGL